MSLELQPSTPGDALLDLCRNSRQDLVLAAPFIKVGALERLLTCVDEDVSPVCITRWRPAEIAAGVSDLDVFSILTERNGNLWLRQDLHAKYFRGDENVLVGSANLTAAALGWSTSPNFELLLAVDRNTEGVADFERVALRGAVEVDHDLYEAFAAAAQDWATPKSPDEVDLLPPSESATVDLSRWLPALRRPGDLYAVYQTPVSDDIPAATREAGSRDLAVLQPPIGLSEEAFNRAIGAALLSLPVMSLIDRHVASPQRFGAIRDLLKDRLDLTHDDASRTWQTLIRWLRHFLPDRYEYSRPRHSEIISRASVK